MINYKDIQTYYKYFVECVSNAHSFSEFLMSDINKFLEEYYKLDNYDEIFADNLELALANIENYYMMLENMEEYIENVNLPILKLSQAEIIDFMDYIEIPENYDEDTYVNLDNPINISDMCKKVRPNLRLYIDDENNLDK